jgi:hypothetical protein
MPPKREGEIVKKKTKGKHKRGGTSTAGGAHDAETGNATWDWQDDDGSRGWYGGWGGRLDGDVPQPVETPDAAEASNPPPRKKKQKRQRSPVAEAVDAAAAASASANVADAQAAPAAAYGSGTIDVDA